MSFQLRQGDAAQLYMRMEERNGADKTTLQMLSTYKVFLVEPSKTRPGANLYIVEFNTSDMRHSTIKLPPEDQRLVLDVFSKVFILLDEDLRGKRTLNWHEVKARFDKFTAHASKRSKADALRLLLFSALYMQEDLWKSMLDPLLEFQQRKWTAENGKFRMEISRNSPGGLPGMQSAKIRGLRELHPTSMGNGVVHLRTKTSFDSTDLVRQFLQSPIGKLAQLPSKNGTPPAEMKITMAGEGMVTYRVQDGWIETYFDKLNIVSEFGDKQSKRQVLLELHQKRLTR